MKFSAIKRDGGVSLPTLLINNFVKKYPDKTVFTLEIEKLKESKSRDQLGYLHAEILPKMVAGFEDCGHDLPLAKKDKIESVKYFIKTHPEIRFMEKKKNLLTGEVAEVPRSFSGATMDETRKIIDWCIRFAGEYLGVEIEQPKRR